MRAQSHIPQIWTESGRSGSLISRRQFLSLAAFALGPWATGTVQPPDLSTAQAPSTPSAASRLSEPDQTFLEDLSHRAFRYFWETADPGTGLVLDRARNDGALGTRHGPPPASIAATGFGLTALAIGADRQWVNPVEARQRALVTLRFFRHNAYHQRGWFYHWMDPSTGERRWNSEVSSIDTALLLAGVLVAKQCFPSEAEIVRLATEIYQRIDFPWMLNGSPTFLSMGWKPEGGFLRSRWDHYVEETILYLLAIGSPAHAIAPKAWYALRRPQVVFAGYRFVAGARPLFIHQYSHAWVDYRGRREAQGDGIDYFENSIAATRAHREFCMALSSRFPKSYSPDVWGITASDSARGYIAWGGPPADPAIDGTLVPSAAAGSLMFTPDICLPALRTMRERFGGSNYGRYGFADAFNPTTQWADPDVIGIDLGITLLSAENLRTGSVWRWFMRNPEIQAAMELIALRKEGHGEHQDIPSWPP